MHCHVMGASGYSGSELVSLLAAHAHVRLGVTTASGGTPHEAIIAAVKKNDCVFLATPAEVSMHWAPLLLAAGARVIDLSGAFRLQDKDAYPRDYGFVHTAPALLQTRAYGLSELAPAPAQLTANPGCYATAAALGALPLGGLVARDLIVDAASGTTGAGRQASEAFSFNEIANDSRAYKVLQHQHTAEIVQTLALAWQSKPWLTLTTKLLPITRGILATVYARLNAPMSSQALTEVYRSYYAAHPLVHIVDSPNDVRIKNVVQRNITQIGVACTSSDTDPGRVVVTVALDNLRKGAASQAIENFDRLLAGGSS